MSRIFANGTNRRAEVTSPGTLGSSFSVSCWVRGVPPITFARAWRFIASGGANVVQLATGDASGTLRLQRAWSTTAEGVDWSAAAHGISNGTWAHLAIVSPATATTDPSLLYVNGTLVSHTARTAPVGTLTGTGTMVAFTMGNIEGAAAISRGWDWEVAHVCWNDVALTQSEVREAMRRGYTLRGIHGYWPLWGKDPGSEPDYSGNRRTATITGTDADTSRDTNPPTAPTLFAFPTYALGPVATAVELSAGAASTAAPSVRRAAARRLAPGSAVAAGITRAAARRATVTATVAPAVRRAAARTATATASAAATVTRGAARTVGTVATIAAQLAAGALYVLTITATAAVSGALRRSPALRAIAGVAASAGRSAAVTRALTASGAATAGAVRAVARTVTASGRSAVTFAAALASAIVARMFDKPRPETRSDTFDSPSPRAGGFDNREE